jgi:hypothetical protein
MDTSSPRISQKGQHTQRFGVEPVLGAQNFLRQDKMLSASAITEVELSVANPS